MRQISQQVVLLVSLAAATEANADLIFNGDFEVGNVGFSSNYTFASIQSGATVYNIVTDPADDHNQATSYGDHTSGSGLMMAVNGCCEPPVLPIPVVWSQTVSVIPDVNYSFSMFLSSWFPQAPAVLQVSADELGVLGSVTAPLAAGSWQKFMLSFNSGPNNLLTLRITDTFVLPGGAGNDFALDDISLVQVPQVVGIDIKPGGFPNCFNVNGKGVIPVALLGSASLDVTNVDQSSLSFGGLEVRVRGNKGPLCQLEDVNFDGFYDLVCHFDDDADNWSPGDGEATLSGQLLDGTQIEGTDSICIVP